ncbi:MAG: thioesterase domain-containing protein [Woeseiaceae bacterium]|nr:thioesterase domain-containing protein [Woeseiaceae bacterium]
MTELNAKLARLSDTDRAELYRELLDRLGEPSGQVVRELLLVYEKRAEAGPDAIRDIARNRLPEHERPTRFIATDKLPRTPHGKLDRRALPGLIRHEHPLRDRPVTHAEHSDEILDAVIETFERVLETSSIVPESNFFERGGHSLLAVECVLALEKKTGKRITITQFLNHPTARGIAAQLHKLDTPDYDYVHLVSENLAGLPVFVFSGSRLAYALKKQKPDWSVYGVQLRWRTDEDEEIEYRGLEDMAGRIVKEISRVCSAGEFVLIGNSFPGILAFEVARQLRAAGREPRLTILIEPTSLYSFRALLEMDLQARGVLKEGQNPYIRWLVANHPFQARFWNRLRRFATRKQLTRRMSEKSSIPSEEQHSYRSLRTTDLWMNYRPPAYDGPTVLMISNETGPHSRRTWTSHLRNLTAVHGLDKGHTSIFDDPFMTDEVVPVLIAEVESGRLSAHTR